MIGQDKLGPQHIMFMIRNVAVEHSQSVCSTNYRRSCLADRYDVEIPLSRQVFIVYPFSDELRIT